MNIHQGFSCDVCHRINFRGHRYKCLRCPNYDLCVECHAQQSASEDHLTSHPMQCILTYSDRELFYGGEDYRAELTQSYTCPFCAEMGFNNTTLLDHVLAEHSTIDLDVICPVCACLPGGGVNQVTGDFIGHMMTQHRTRRRDLLSVVDQSTAMRTTSRTRGRRQNIPLTLTPNIFSLSGENLSQLSIIAENDNHSPQSSDGELPQTQPQPQPQPQPLPQPQSQPSPQLQRHQPTGTGRTRRERTRLRTTTATATQHNDAGTTDTLSGTEVVRPTNRRNAIIGLGSIAAALRGNTNLSSWNTPPQRQHPRQSKLADCAVSIKEPESTCSAANAENSAPGKLAGSVAAKSADPGTTNDGESKFFLNKFLAHPLSDAEIADIELERASRSQFVQALLLSTLASDTLDSANANGNKSLESAAKAPSSQQKADAAGEDSDNGSDTGGYRPLLDNMMDEH